MATSTKQPPAEVPAEVPAAESEWVNVWPRPIRVILPTGATSDIGEPLYTSVIVEPGKRLPAAVEDDERQMSVLREQRYISRAATVDEHLNQIPPGGLTVPLITTE